eukprot:403353087
MSGRKEQPYEERLKPRTNKKNLDIQEIEKELAELESEDSEIEILKKNINKKRLFNDKQWKIIVGIFGSGIAIGLIILTLFMVEQLLSGGSST